MFFHTFLPQKVGELAETLYLRKIYLLKAWTQTRERHILTYPQMTHYIR